MTFELRADPQRWGTGGPLVVAVLDGVGLGRGDEADAVYLARTPALDSLRVEGRWTALRAHGTAVGLPNDDDMGNSEVGHNALGCGVVHDQGAALVDKAVRSGDLFRRKVWREIVERCVTRGSALHLIGLLSDGNVHSHIDHLLALIRGAAQARIQKIYVHVLLDGRDVAPTSAMGYLETLEQVLSEVRASGIDAAIASGGGRMVMTMDRYGADWGMVKTGWDAHVLGVGPRHASARVAVESGRAQNPEGNDQYLPPFVVTRDGEPLGRVLDGDAVILFNFRGDRALEISQAFEVSSEAAFEHFDRVRVPDVLYAGMMEYDGDAKIPTRYLVEPPQIERTLSEYLVHNGVSQLAIAETQKFGHMTYFWNGNRSGKFDAKRESYVEIPSDLAPFAERPWMKAAEITDRLIIELRTGRYKFARVNYANGDMVGHTGSKIATIIAMEAIDLQVRRLLRVVDELGGVLVVTADHGNADEMFQYDNNGDLLRVGKNNDLVVKTSHTLNPVPFMIYDSNPNPRYRVHAPPGAGIANATATFLQLLGFLPPEAYAPGLLRPLV